MSTELSRGEPRLSDAEKRSDPAIDVPQNNLDTPNVSKASNRGNYASPNGGLSTPASVIPPPEKSMDDRALEIWLAKYNIEQREYEEKFARSRINTIILMAFLLFVAVAFYFASIQNPGLYSIDQETLRYTNRAFNAGVLLLIPFILGAVGALTRLLISGMVVAEHLGLLVASGLISAFSWVGIKSGVLMKIVAPHLANHGVTEVSSVSFEAEFYTMALVALMVGMFSSNVYIFVNEKIERVLANKKTDSNSPK